MKKNAEYIIPYEGLKEGKHNFTFKIGDKFFEQFDSEQNFRNVEIDLNVDLMKDVTMLMFDFEHKGEVKVDCDRCLAEIPQYIRATNKLIVKFGENTNEDDEMMVTLPNGEYEIDLAPYIYDYICLSFPWKKDCSDLSEEEKNCDSEMLKKIEALEVKAEPEDTEGNPLWEELKKLK